MSFKNLCDYAHTYPDDAIQYNTSDISLYCDIDVDFLLQPNSWSRYAGYFYLIDGPPPDPIKPKPKPNVPVLGICKILRGLLASVAEFKTGGVFQKS